MKFLGLGVMVVLMLAPLCLAEELEVAEEKNNFLSNMRQSFLSSVPKDAEVTRDTLNLSEEARQNTCGDCSIQTEPFPLTGPWYFFGDRAYRLSNGVAVYQSWQESHQFGEAGDWSATIDTSRHETFVGWQTCSVTFSGTYEYVGCQVVLQATTCQNDNADCFNMGLQCGSFDDTVNTEQSSVTTFVEGCNQVIMKGVSGSEQTFKRAGAGSLVASVSAVALGILAHTFLF
mmetsp:Transcript_19804/g.55674  ORF Transcript_19804/g.55674 Transcript_19804/m.55674 type:complete len:231 (+) Transcript_19804:111-803(+)